MNIDFTGDKCHNYIVNSIIRDENEKFRVYSCGITCGRLYQSDGWTIKNDVKW